MSHACVPRRTEVNVILHMTRYTHTTQHVDGAPSSCNLSMVIVRTEVTQSADIQKVGPVYTNIKLTSFH